MSWTEALIDQIPDALFKALIMVGTWHVLLIIEYGHFDIAPLAITGLGVALLIASKEQRKNMDRV